MAVIMLKSARCPASCLLTIAITLTLVQPVHARHEFKVLGLVLTTIVAGSYFGSWYFTDEFGDYTRKRRFYSDNPTSEAAGAEDFYRPDQKVIGYTIQKNTLTPHVTRLGQVESWFRYYNTGSNRKTRINQLLLHNDADYQHWKLVFPNKPDTHFNRYIANLSAYCETGIRHGESIILAFHTANLDLINFRNTCREWLDQTIDKTNLLIGSEANTPVVLAPIWMIKEDRLVSTPRIYYVVNPYFTPAGNFIPLNDFPVSFFLQGTNAHNFELYPLVAFFSRIQITQLRNTPSMAVKGQVVNDGIVFQNFGTRENMTVPYMMEHNVDKEQFLIFRTNNQLETWPVYGDWSSDFSPLHVDLKYGQFSLSLDNIVPALH